MSDVALPLFVHVTNQKLVTKEGGGFTLPDAKLGDTWVGELRFLQDGTDAVVEKKVKVVSFKAQIGPIMECPARGKFRLVVNGGEPTEELNFDVDANSLATKLGSGVTSVFKADDGCWIVRLENEDGTVEAADDSVTNYNTLSPQSFVRCRAYVENGITYHEVRLIVAPYAFTQSLVPATPDEPRTVRVLNGAAATDSTPAINQIQQIRFPASFVGSYYLTWKGHRSVVLGGQDGPEEVTDALNRMFDDGKVRFNVTNPETEIASVEFVGPLAASEQSHLEVTVVNVDLVSSVFRLPLNRANMVAALRKDKTRTTTFEMEIRHIGANEDPEDPEVEINVLTVQADVKLLREAIFEELALVPNHDWLRTMGRVSYIPFAPGAVITGSQYARIVIGDGETAVFSISHGMNSDEIANILVRENKANGRVLKSTEYSAVVTDEDQILIGFTSAPALNSLAIVISTINNVATFQDHQHPIAGIIGDEEGQPTLREELDALSARLVALEDLVSVTGGLVRSDVTVELDFELPKRSGVYPGRYASLPDLSKANLPGKRLFPAIHDALVAAIDELPLPSPDEYAGSVFYNDTGAPIILRGIRIPVEGFFGSDGRGWYGLTRSAATNSYFPTEMVRELWTLSINDAMLRPGMAFNLEAELLAGLYSATTKVGCILAIEIGTAPSQGTPNPTATNLQDVIWNTAAPLLAQRLVLTDVIQKTPYGCTIQIDSGGNVVAKKSVYHGSSTAVNKPANANFVIRGVIRDVDTENSVTGAKGLIYYESTGKAGIA